MKIKVTEQVHSTAVWYLSKGKGAIIASVSRVSLNNWSVNFNGQYMFGYKTKSKAIEGAKKALRENVEREIHS